MIVQLLLVSQLSFSQYELKEIPRNHTGCKLVILSFSSSEGEKGITVYEYGTDGLISTSKWTLLDKSRSSINYYKNDNDGNIIEKYREFSDKITSIQTFEYDSDNRLKVENFNRSDGISYHVTYTYNNQGRIEAANCYGLHGWFNGRISFSYNERGLLDNGKLSQDGFEVGFIKFTHDEQERLIEEYWEIPDSYNQTFTFEYTNLDIAYSSSNVFITNTSNYKIIGEEYDFNKEYGGPSLYYYSTGGKLEKKNFKVNDKIRTKTTYEYNPSGLLTQSLRIFNDGTKTLFKYKFNNDRKLSDRIYYQNDSIIGKEHYEYSNSLLVKGDYLNFDTWLTGSLTFEHDSEGNLTQGFFNGEDGFDADIYFSYDDHFNITKIHWEFSFGKTQTSSFKYEEK